MLLNNLIVYSIFFITLFFLEMLWLHYVKLLMAMWLIILIGLASLYQRRHCHIEQVIQSQIEGLACQEYRQQVVALRLIRAATHTQQT
jgi:hypothetical protein